MRFLFLNSRRIPSVEQPVHDAPKVPKAPSPINDPAAFPITNTQNVPSSNINNRRELPNVPKNTMNVDTKPQASSSSNSQNPFYNPSTTTNNPTGISTSRSTPSQWMENIGQTLRRQTSNIVDVRRINSFRID